MKKTVKNSVFKLFRTDHAGNNAEVTDMAHAVSVAFLRPYEISCGELKTDKYDTKFTYSNNNETTTENEF